MHLASPAKLSTDGKKIPFPFSPTTHKVKSTLSLRSKNSKSGDRLCILQKGIELNFDGGLTKPTESYEKLINGVYKGKDKNGAIIEVELTNSTPGFVFFSDKHIDSNQDLDKLIYDKVVEPASPIAIQVGDPLGYPGPYFDDDGMVHFEIFTDSFDFYKNRKGDAGANNWIKISSQATIYSYQPVVKVLFSGERVNLNTIEKRSVELNKIYTKQYRPIITASGEEGIVEKISLSYEGEDSEGNIIYKVRDETNLLAYLPPNPPSDLFEKIQNKIVEPLYIKSAGETIIDKSSNQWHKIIQEDSKEGGWVNTADSHVTSASAYEWPNWTIADESSEEGNGMGFSEDGFCDSKKLLKWLDKDNNAQIDAKEIKQANNDPYLFAKLWHLVCVHPSEWDAKTDNNVNKWERLKKDPWNLTEDKYKEVLDEIKFFQWWDDITSISLPNPLKLFHPHPIGFLSSIEQLDVPFDESAKQRVMKEIALIESNDKYDGANKDYEFKGKIQMGYSGIVHIGLSWGFIQFTQDGGSLGNVLRYAYDKDKNTFESTFGSNSEVLINMLEKAGNGMKLWKKLGRPKSGDELEIKKVGRGLYVEVHNNILEKSSNTTSIERTKILVSSKSMTEIKGHTDTGTSKIFNIADINKVIILEIRGDRVRKLAIDKNSDVVEDLWEGEWLKRFNAAGRIALFKEAQIKIAENEYLTPTLKYCKAHHLRSEKSIAFVFDRCVNQGVGGAKKILNAHAKAIGIPISGLWEYDYLQQMKTTVQKKLSGFSRRLALARLERIMKEEKLSVTNYDPGSYL